MAVSKRLRYEVLRRDNHACRYCGGTAPDVALTVDHVIPVALGGSDDPSNLVTACADCNAGKSSASADATVVDDVAAGALRWAKAMQWAAEQQAEQRQVVEAFARAVDTAWLAWTWTDRDGVKHNVDRPSDWAASLATWMAAGITTDDVAEAIRIAMRSKARDEWRYTCGVIWNQLRDRQQLAASYLAEA